MTKKKMGAMKLSQFSGIKVETSPEPPPPSEPKSELKADKQVAKPETTKSKLVTINIKVTSHQHEWLNDTARAVRDNNTDPVPPGERVYPQHLIAVAIDLLQNSGVDWSQVKNVEDLKEQLNL